MEVNNGKYAWICWGVRFQRDRLRSTAWQGSHLPLQMTNPDLPNNKSQDASCILAF